MKIGFIDYFLDEWHANHYPEWIRQASNGEMTVCYAYADIDSPFGGKTTAEWCAAYGVEQCKTIEELVEKSDCIVVLSPDNCEQHERLCQIPLHSGKRCYVDKTFAPDLETAQRIFEMAESSSTPCYSSSALRFADEYADIDRSGITAVSCMGAGGLDTYGIHQIEPLTMLMGADVKRVMYVPSENWYTLVLDYADGRKATVTGFMNGCPFVTVINTNGENRYIEVKSDFFQNFIAQLVDFFRTGEEKVSHADTLAVMKLRQLGMRAAQQPSQWLEV